MGKLFSYKSNNKSHLQAMHNLEKRLEALDGATVETGYFPESGQHSNGMSYQKLYAIQHYGSEKAHIPPRPVLDIVQMMKPIAKAKPFKIGMKQYYSDLDKPTGKIRLDKCLDNIGAYYQKEARHLFGSDELQANSAYTVGLKGKNSPLIDTGELKKNLGYKTSKNNTVTK